MAPARRAANKSISISSVSALEIVNGRNGAELSSAGSLLRYRNVNLLAPILIGVKMAYSRGREG